MEYQIYTEIGSDFPISFSTDIGTKTYTFKILYNERFDFYSLYIYDTLDILLYSTRITYFSPILNRAIDENLDNEKNKILFIDESELSSTREDYFHTKVNKDNFMKTVFMVVIDVSTI